jgi:hypothetical protein
MPTIKLPEESQHNDMVKKVDAMIREITKAPSMTASTRALGLRPSILIGEHQELAHIMAKRGLLNLQNHMIGLAVAGREVRAIRAVCPHAKPPARLRTRQRTDRRARGDRRARHEHQPVREGDRRVQRQRTDAPPGSVRPGARRGPSEAR